MTVGGVLERLEGRQGVDRVSAPWGGSRRATAQRAGTSVRAKKEHKPRALRLKLRCHEVDVDGQRVRVPLATLAVRE